MLFEQTTMTFLNSLIAVVVARTSVFKIKQDTQCRCNVKLRRVLVTTVAV
jgi:hypothetical protein